MALYPTISSGYVTYGSGGWPTFGEGGSGALEDFESQSIAVYGDDTDAFQVQGNNVLQGRYSLESTVGQKTIGASESDRPTPRGTDSDPIEYKCRMVLSDSGQASLLTNAQSADSPWSNCYGVLVDEGNDRIRMFRREAGSTTYHENSTVGTTLNTGTEYRPAITISGSGLKATLYDATNSVIYETDSYADQTFTGGGLGWHNGIGTTTYFDYATSGPGTIDDVGSAVLEDFESGNLNGYWIRSTSGSASVAPAAAYRGSYGLDMDGFSEIQTTPGGGRPGYIQSGVPVKARLYPHVTGDQQYWIPFCPTTRDSRENRYILQLTMAGGFRIQKNDSGSASTVPGSSSEGRDYAALYNLSYSTDTWYTIALEVDQSNGLYAELYDGGGNRMGWISSGESEFINSENGYGFYCSGSGRVFYDELREI